MGICPWNFPFFVMARKLAPALLTGNTVVVKSSEVTPLTCFKFAQLLEEAVAAGKLDMAPGLVAILTGSGATIGDALCSSPAVGIISMTGSVATGQRIMRTAAANMTKAAAPSAPSRRVARSASVEDLRLSAAPRGLGEPRARRQGAVHRDGRRRPRQGGRGHL